MIFGGFGLGELYAMSVAELMQWRERARVRSGVDE
ncbi:GpE family phage tail protein [Ralstonia solanacearum]|nr:phage tail protein [Ralstonia solanacearum]